ncbi:MAG: hypothetical protein WBD46_15875 [Acidobacteriaceae bacterium]
MQVHDIVTELNGQIARLKEARALLAGSESGPGKRGRPAKKSAAGRKRRLTPEGRKRISDALKRRWAARRKEKASAAKK